MTKHMLGTQIGEAKGKITGERIVDAEGPKIEYTFLASGRMKGVEITHMATFWTVSRGNEDCMVRTRSTDNY